jgi:hypothetical protein
MGAAVLITLGVLFLLDNYRIVQFDRSLPVLLLVIGCVLLVSRTGSTEGHIERGWIQAPPVSPQSAQPWTTGVVPPPPPPQQWTLGPDNPPSSPEQNDTQVKP